MSNAKLEHEMADLGKRRYQKRRLDRESQGHTTYTPAGRYLLREAVGPFMAALEEDRKEVAGRPQTSSQYRLPAEAGITCEQLALLTSRAILDRLGKYTGYQTVSFGVALAVETEMQVRWFEENHGDRWRYFQSKLRKAAGVQRIKLIRTHLKQWEALPAWSLNDKRKLGMYLTELFAKHTGLVQIIPGQRKHKFKKPTLIIELSPLAQEWLEKAHTANEELAPFYLPLTELPQDWLLLNYGGYTTDIARRKNLVKYQDKSAVPHFAPDKMPKVYSAINFVQRTGWQVNKPVLEALEHFWEINSEIGDLPAREDMPLPPRPPREDKEGWQGWRKMAFAVHERNRVNKSAKLSTVQQLWIAGKYREKRVIYYPAFLDFRGRQYNIPSFLAPQGDNRSRGILQFAKAKPIATQEHERWLAIHGANCWGEDKSSFDTRLEWVEKNSRQIAAVADDPLGCRWWGEADKPWEFLAWCLEWAAFRKEGYGFESRIPCQVDGSNNGLQIYACLLADADLALRTNCSPTEWPTDIYADVAKRTHALLEARLLAGDELAQPWVELLPNGLSRSAVKQPVMTLAYAVTKYGVSAFITDWFVRDCIDKKIKPFGNNPWKHTRYLASLVWASMQEVISPAVATMRWLHKVSDTFTTVGLPLFWKTPSGFPVAQRYCTYTAQQINCRVGFRCRNVRFRTQGSEIHRRKQRNGIAPNYIHSLDSAILHLAMNSLESRGVESVFTVHDAFGTHACDVPILNQVLRDTYVQVFQQDQLSLLTQQLRKQLRGKAEIPDPPERGTFDVRTIRDSQYAFA